MGEAYRKTGSDPWQAPDFRQVIDSAGKICFQFALPEKLLPSKAAYVNRISQKILSLALPGMQAPEQIITGEAQDAFVADCGLYQPLLIPGKVRKYSAGGIDWLMLDLAGKLQELHERGIVVLTLPPWLFLVNDEGEHPRGAVTGFLDAMDLSFPYPVAATGLYHPSFAAPEIAECLQVNRAGAEPLPGAVCDVYALGILYHLLLCGTMPEQEEDTDDDDSNGVRLSGRLDIPHRDLLAMMLLEDPGARLQSMNEVCREIRRILFSGDCYIRIRCPDLANRFITVQGSRGGKTRKKLDQAGCAQIGPLLSDQEYVVTCRNRELFRERFPGAESGQILWLSNDTREQQFREVEHYAEPAPQKKTIPEVMRSGIRHSTNLDPPLNNICRIDYLSGPFCILTLVNGRSFWIRKEAAFRYGIGHLMPEK